MIFSKTRRSLYLIVVIIIISCFYFGKFYYEPFAKYFKYTQTSLGTTLSYHIGEIKFEKMIQQSFVAKENGLSKIKIFFSTFNRNNTGTTIIEILDDQKTSIRRLEIENSSIKDNDYRLIEFEPISKSKNKVFIIKIYSIDTKDNNAVTVWIDENKTGLININGEEKKGSLVIGMVYEKQFSFSQYLLTVFILSLVCIIMYKVLNFLRRK